MEKVIKNVAYIDGANLHNATKELGWKFDYGRFLVWLREKYNIEKAYLFIGMIPKYKDLYTRLQKYGYTLIFKEVTYDITGKPKGNCDSDLVVQVMQDAYEDKFDKAVLVSSDGDFAPLIKFLITRNKIEVVISAYKPSQCSMLIKRTGVRISYIIDQKNILEVLK